jgi:hypothetical protein
MKSRYAAVVVLLSFACSKAEAPATRAEAEPAPGTPEWKIRNARSAAPPMIGMNALIMEITDSAMTQMDTIQAASAGSTWVCFSDFRFTNFNDPVCADDRAMTWWQAWMRRERPQLPGMGVVYALQGGGTASDTDPFKMQPDSGWIMDGPSIYVLMPNASAYQGLPTTRRADGPWVRFAGTPYAYIVMPAGTQ